MMLGCSATPPSQLNKVSGLGFAPFSAPEWEGIEAAHAVRNAPIQVELSKLADPTIVPLLTGRGFHLVGAESVLGRALAPPGQPRGCRDRDA